MTHVDFKDIIDLWLFYCDRIFFVETFMVFTAAVLVQNELLMEKMA
jgi:hypothetical protein